MSTHDKKMLAIRYAALPYVEQQLVRAELSIDDLSALDSLVDEVRAAMLLHRSLTKDEYRAVVAELERSLTACRSPWDKFIALSELSPKKLPVKLLQIINDVTTVKEKGALL